MSRYSPADHGGTKKCQAAGEADDAEAAKTDGPPVGPITEASLLDPYLYY
jgi:hypothetical protein